MDFIGGALAFFTAACVSVLNGLNTNRMLKKQNQNRKFFWVYILRQLINISLLSTVFLIRNCLPFSYVYLLIGTAMGITVPSIILALYSSKKIKANQ